MRVVVALSGGVDSAVAALLLKERGFEVQGLFMSNWEEDDDAYCTAARDFQDARAVAAELGIPLHRVSFASEYRERVFAHFLAEHRAGRTPNPDVLCNREIKFGDCLRHARRLGAERLATGHYARLATVQDGIGLFTARDEDKDQTYFLHAVPRQQFTHALFPLGGLLKAEVREHARRAGLPVFDKPDSTGICFIGERPYREFLARYLAENPGPIETPDGVRLGTHRGLAFYTLGQRAGLEIGGQRGRAELPWYAAAKDAAHNTLVVVQGHDHPRLFTQTLCTGPVNWLAPPAGEGVRVTVRCRHRQARQPARVAHLGPDLRVLFEQPQRAVTPGQYAVFYDGERCLGGAVIESLEPMRADIIQYSQEPAHSTAPSVEDA